MSPRGAFSAPLMRQNAFVTRAYSSAPQNLLLDLERGMGPKWDLEWKGLGMKRKRKGKKARGGKDFCL